MVFFPFYFIIIFIIKSSLQKSFKDNSNFIIENSISKDLILRFVRRIVNRLKIPNQFDETVLLCKEVWNITRPLLLGNKSIEFLIFFADDILFNKTNPFLNDTYDIITKNNNSAILLDDSIIILH